MLVVLVNSDDFSPRPGLDSRTIIDLGGKKSPPYGWLMIAGVISVIASSASVFEFPVRVCEGVHLLWPPNSRKWWHERKLDEEEAELMMLQRRVEALAKNIGIIEKK